MVHIADIAARTMGIGCGGDSIVPEMDPFAMRMRKNVDEITAQKGDIAAQVEAIMGREEEDREG